MVVHILRTECRSPVLAFLPGSLTRKTMLDLSGGAPSGPAAAWCSRDAAALILRRRRPVQWHQWVELHAEGRTQKNASLD